jgi:N-acyl-L-homoserine lactone synthetase
MIVVVEEYNAHKYSNLMDEMFRLRARVFHDRLGWDVQVKDGRERDRYDDESPVYIIYADEKGREVKGSMRLLPTTGPTLLADYFYDTVPDAVHLSAPTIWEGTRFCLNEGILDKGPGDWRLYASGVMIAALGDVTVRAGVESIVANVDATMLRLCRRIGCKFEVLGSTLRYGRPVYLVLFAVHQPSLRRLKRKLSNGLSAYDPPARMVA